MKAKLLIQAVLAVLFLTIPQQSQAAAPGRVAYDLGVFAFDEENFSEAEIHFAAAVSQAPDNPYYHQFLGRTYLKEKRPQDAVRSLEAAWQLDPGIRGLQYDLALASYESGDFQRAEGLFDDLAAEEPDNVLARYYLGLTYFKQERYGEALPPLLQAGEENASIRDNSFYFAGISHYKTDEPEPALEKLAYVETNTTSEQLKESAREWQEVIRSNRAKEARYNLMLKLGLEYDDNVRLDPIDQDLFADEGDFVSSVYFSGRYRLLNSPARKAGIGYSHYMTFHHDLSEFDLTAGVLTLFYQERLTRDLYVSLQYNPSQYWVDSDHYLLRHQVGPTVVYRFNDRNGLRFSYDYTDNGYLMDKGRSGHDHEVMVDFFSLLFNNKGQITIGAGYSSRSTDDPDYEYDLVRTRLEFSYSLPLELKFVLRGGWDWREYDNIDSMYSISREDDRYSGGVELSRPLFWRCLEIAAAYRYTRNDSNISYYSYEKNVSGLYLTAEF